MPVLETVHVPCKRCSKKWALTRRARSPTSAAPYVHRERERERRAQCRAQRQLRFSRLGGGNRCMHVCTGSVFMCAHSRGARSSAETAQRQPGDSAETAQRQPGDSAEAAQRQLGGSSLTRHPVRSPHAAVRGLDNYSNRVVGPTRVGGASLRTVAGVGGIHGADHLCAD